MNIYNSARYSIFGIYQEEASMKNEAKMRLVIVLTSTVELETIRYGMLQSSSCSKRVPNSTLTDKS